MDKKIIWQPLDGSQTLAMSCPCNMILYHGTRGPGKTDSQLMRFRRRVGMGYGRHYRGVIFDREYKNLEDLISKSLRWYPEFNDGARFLSSNADLRWVWPTGEELLFRTVKKESDYWNFHGHEFPFIGWNELTKYANDILFEAMMSCNRTSFRPEDYPVYISKSLYEDTGIIQLIDEDDYDAIEHYLPELQLEVFATCNPYGVGHNWVKKRFINAAPMGKILKNTINVFNPRTQQREDVTKTQVHIFGSYRENKYLPPEYVATLESITDENKRKAWLKGDWDVVAGGMFDGNWSHRVHVVTPFKIPSSWKIDRSFDYGSSKPFSVGWWAESDGSDVQLPDGTWHSTVKGDLFRIAEWYGCTNKPNEGLRMLASDIAKGIVQRELAMGLYGRVSPGPADNSINDPLNVKSSIAKEMQTTVTINGKKYPGVRWKKSNKSPGSRKMGWEKIRQFMENAKPQFIITENGVKIPLPREEPGLFIFNNCKCCIDLLPTLPRDEVDPDDVDTDAEDHIGDEVRYKLLSVGGTVTSGKTTGYN